MRRWAPAALAAAKNDEQDAVAPSNWFTPPFPFPVHMAVKEEAFVKFCFRAQGPAGAHWRSGGRFGPVARPRAPGATGCGRVCRRRRSKFRWRLL